MLSKAKLALTLGTLIVLTTGWAAPLLGAAHSYALEQSRDPLAQATALSPIRFRKIEAPAYWLTDGLTEPVLSHLPSTLVRVRR